MLDEESTHQKKKDDFLLPTPSEGDIKGIKIRIYLFSTPKFININIYKKSLVGEVVKHVMTLYRKDKLLNGSCPLNYPDEPNAYELRLIDDDEDIFVPLYEIGSLDKKDEIGEFEGLAMVEKKGYAGNSKGNF